MARVQVRQKSQKLMIACRKCGRQSANSGRGLCGICYSVERKAGTIDNWPKLTADELQALHRAPGKDPEAPSTITLEFSSEKALKILEQLKQKGAEHWRTVEGQIMYELETAVDLFARPMSVREG